MTTNEVAANEFDGGEFIPFCIGNVGVNADPQIWTATRVIHHRDGRNTAIVEGVGRWSLATIVTTVTR